MPGMRFLHITMSAASSTADISPLPWTRLFDEVDVYPGQSIPIVNLGPFTFLYDQWRIVAGRNIVDGRPVTQVCLLDGDNLVDLVRLPSGGDCSYPSMVSLCPGCILVAWYSSHEDAHAKIYTAKLNFN